MHVPWCRVRCPYCAFYVVPGNSPAPWRPFVDRLASEYAQRRPAFPGPAATAFLGGGTPSRLPPEALAALIGGLELTAEAEVSAEANPEDLTDAWIDGAQQAGLNRISVGVQSFVTPLSRRLGRAHTLDQADAACRRLAGAELRSWSVDLIFAVPGQTLQHLEADLDRIEDLGAPHVSVYGLTIEPGTAFARAAARGALPSVPDDRWRRLYDRLVERLTAAGLERYEVSNFARPGHRCAHNVGYWTDRPYLGLGPSAHGYEPTGARWSNVADLSGWLETGDPSAERHEPSPHQAATDRLLSGLRGVDGVPLEALRLRTGLSPGPDAVTALVRGGVLLDDPDRLVLTPAGFPVCDAVVTRLIDALRPAQ